MRFTRRTPAYSSPFYLGAGALLPKTHSLSSQTGAPNTLDGSASAVAYVGGRFSV